MTTAIPGSAVPAFHPGCTGRLTLIQAYGRDIVTCDACEEEFPVEKRRGIWYFAEVPDA